MKTQVVITITHPDAMSASWFKADVVDPFISEINEDSNDEWTYTVAPTQTEEQLRERALRSSIELALSEFSRGMENDWIIDAILNNDNNIVVWEPFANWDSDVLVQYIEETADTIYHTYFQ